MPELNFDSDFVRQTMVDVAKYYIDMGVDGFRFDAAKYIYYGNEPENAEFWLEKGAVHTRFNQMDEATEALKKAIALDDKLGAAYRMLGYCQVKEKKNAEACENFMKAKELGDTVVIQLIEKYCK